jgi:hypothetical protein
MRFTTLAIFAPLVALAAADYMVVNTVCYSDSACSSQDGTWYSGYGTYSIDASDGCRNPGAVPAMYNLCVDWANSRAHFFFNGQPKRCLRKTEDGEYWCPPLPRTIPVCYRSVWSEVACTW